MIISRTIGKNGRLKIMSDLDFVAQTLLSADDKHIILKKRQNFIKKVNSSIEEWLDRYEGNWAYIDQLPMIIASNIFDEGVVN